MSNRRSLENLEKDQYRKGQYRIIQEGGYQVIVSGKSMHRVRREMIQTQKSQKS